MDLTHKYEFKSTHLNIYLSTDIGFFLTRLGPYLDRISQRGANLLFGQIVSKTVHKIKKIGSEEGGARPKVVLCRSATDSNVKDRTPSTFNVLTETFSILVNEQCQGHTKSYHY